MTATGTKLDWYLFLALPLYVAPCLLRSALLPFTGWAVGMLLSDALGSFVVAFLTNNLRAGILLFAGSMVFETALAVGFPDAGAALWIGGLLPASAAIYFARKLLSNMCD